MLTNFPNRMYFNLLKITLGSPHAQLLFKDGVLTDNLTERIIEIYDL